MLLNRLAYLFLSKSLGRSYLIVIVEASLRAGKALHLLHGSTAAALALYDPRFSAVAVASHRREWVVGQVVDVTLPEAK